MATYQRYQLLKAADRVKDIIERSNKGTFTPEELAKLLSEGVPNGASVAAPMLIVAGILFHSPEVDERM